MSIPSATRRDDKRGLPPLGPGAFFGSNAFSRSPSSSGKRHAQSFGSFDIVGTSVQREET
jgi:hypothetical protein